MEKKYEFANKKKATRTTRQRSRISSKRKNGKTEQGRTKIIKAKEKGPLGKPLDFSS